MKSMPLRRNDQIHFTSDAESGVTLPLTATGPGDRSVPSVPRSMLRGTTAAQLRAVGWEEAVCAHTLRQSARIMEALTAQGLMPVRLGESPNTQQGGGGHRPHHGGRRGGRLLMKRPRVSRRRASRRPKVFACRRGREGRSKALGFQNVLLFVFPFLFFSFSVAVGLFLFLLSGGLGRRRPQGYPHYDRASWSEGRKWVYRWKIWLFAPRGAAASRCYNPMGCM